MCSQISDRLAFRVDLINVRYCDFKPAKPLTFARNTFRAKLTKNQQKALVLSAVKLGIYSIRPVLMAQKAAQMLSSIDGREEVSNSDLELASVMVLAHRAVTMESTAPIKPMITFRKTKHLKMIKVMSLLKKIKHDFCKI